MWDGHAQKWTHETTGKMLDIKHVERKHNEVRAVNSKRLWEELGRVTFRKANLIFHKTHTLDSHPIPAYFSFLQN